MNDDNRRKMMDDLRHVRERDRSDWERPGCSWDDMNQEADCRDNVMDTDRSDRWLRWTLWYWCHPASMPLFKYTLRPTA